MREWLVSIHQEISYEYTVRAETEEAAREEAMNVYLSGSDGDEEQGDVIRDWVDEAHEKDQKS